MMLGIQESPLKHISMAFFKKKMERLHFFISIDNMYIIFLAASRQLPFSV